MKKKAKQDHNHFERLPDNLLLHIFDAVQDARSLTRCLAVSKTFNSVARLTTSVSVSFCWSPNISCWPFVLPRPDGLDEDPLLKAADAVFASTRPVLKLYTFLLYQYYDHISTRNFYSSTLCRDLEGFKGIHSLRINLIPPTVRDRPAYMLKYCKVDLGGAAQLIKSCIVVDADRYASKVEEGPVRVSLSWLAHKIANFLGRTASIHSLARKIIFSNPTVRNVVITDTCREAKFYAGQNEITDVRTRAGGEHRIGILTRDLCIKLWRVPVLWLPGSGYLLIGVTVAVMMARDLAASRAVNGYGEFLKSYFDRDAGMQEDQDDKERALLIREAVAELSKTIDTLTCYCSLKLFMLSRSV